MNLGQKNSKIVNRVLDGSYSIFIAPVDPELRNFWISKGINPTGITGVYVEYSKGDKNIDRGALPSGFRPNITYVSGASDPLEDSNATFYGYLYYRAFSPLYGVCHGVGSDKAVWYSGYNFYNAFHPEGYISPPFGQNFSTYLKGEYSYEAPYLNGNCPNLSSTEYNDLFGIVSELSKGASASTDTNDPFINSPALSCPQDLSVAYYWREKQYKIIAGTASAITANTYYNSSPIPTSLDLFNVKTILRYSSEDEPIGEKEIKHTINYENGKPISYYFIKSRFGENPINTQICNGIFAEGTLSYAGVSPFSLLLDAPDVLSAPSKSLFDTFVWWSSWHFLFKENSDGFPFSNDYKLASADGGDYLGLAKTPNTANYGSQLFKAELSSEDHYWENRQCPGIIDFLPHTFGASIYACPSYHFDIPYYASINKFGFYGARFLNGCVSLDLQHPLNGVENVIELPSEGYFYITPGDSEPDEDKGINYDNSIYDNLLKIAKSEETYNDFFAFNKLFFLWCNFSFIQTSSEYLYLINKYPSFKNILLSFIGEFDAAFPSGLESLLKNDFLFQNEESKLFYTTGTSYSLLSKNINYKLLTNEISRQISAEDIYYWNLIQEKYLNSILNNNGYVDTGFYDLFINKKTQRLQTVYLENFVRGNAIDLYPSNKITFGFDSSKNFINSYSWGKLTGTFGLRTKFQDSGLSRRYFVGAYGESSDFEGYSNYIKSVNNKIENGSFYPGYFNTVLGDDFSKQDYLSVITGNVFSGEAITKNTITNGKNSLSDGWLALGYGGITKLKGNSSCFTPIFIKQPINTVHCKIGQSPIFRSLAVDYHTIPEDKINDRYPEIMYWTEKLKITNSKYKNKYPLSYKWFRIKKTYCKNNFENFLASGYFSNNGIEDIFHNPNGAFPVEPSDINGEWCCLEGNGPNCTLIHPKECRPVFRGNGSWNSKYEGTPGYEEAKRNNFYMSFKKGAIKNLDDQYYYFCMVNGRFGIRISEPSELFVDDILKFDISIQNGGNAKISPKLSFEIGKEKIEIEGPDISGYAGFHKDLSYIPENVVQQQIPPPNRGWGAVYSYKFVGTWGYGGALQSYTPGTLDDTRGLKETWGRFLHYGSLSKYRKKLLQKEGDLIYGTPHLPYCISGLKQDQKYGILLNIEIDGAKVVHWANMQEPIVSTNDKRGVIWNKLGNAGELYNPISNSRNAYIDSSPSPGLGQWQWGNNLGTIHKFGFRSPNSELRTYPGGLTDKQKNQLKEKLLKYTLDGPDCGWNKCGLGRNMLYWIEGFSSFYIFCDPLKKKNVTNYNYMSPALRHTNSSIQYFWLGKPSNTYLKRYAMFGPYAYQWKFMPHNRDRNGNGMSEAFYSYGWDTNYNLMYDAPAIYGLFRKYRDLSEIEKEEIDQINNLRAQVFGRKNLYGIHYTRFGFTTSSDPSRKYGNHFIGNINEPLENEQNEYIRLMKGYVISGSLLAQRPKFKLYGCDDSDLKNGDCFDPCISIRYQFGILPGGKRQELAFGTPSGYEYNIVPNNLHTGKFFNEETSNLSGHFFRGPFGTPHHVYLKETGIPINGFSPCFDGGADHCNYLTPTINLGASCYLEKSVPEMISVVSQVSSIVSVNYELPF